MADCLIRIVGMALGLGLGLCGAPAAESLPDPTRPPPGIGADAAKGAVAVELAPVLTSVIIPAKGVPLAVIGGKTVRPGERIGDQQVVRITENGVVLAGANGRETMLLTPAVEKKMLGRDRPGGRARVEKQ